MMVRRAPAQAAGYPPALGREPTLPFAARIVSGIQACPKDAAGVRHTAANRATLLPPGLAPKSPDRERCGSSRVGKRLFLLFSCASGVFAADPAQRRRKAAFGIGERRAN